LLPTDEWVVRMKEKQSGWGSSSRSGNGKHHGKVPQKELDPNACRRCGNPKEKVEAHLALVPVITYWMNFKSILPVRVYMSILPVRVYIQSSIILRISHLSAVVTVSRVSPVRL
jgi:hypothetical protein